MFQIYVHWERHHPTHHFIIIHLVKINTVLCEVLGNVYDTTMCSYRAPPPQKEGGYFVIRRSPVSEIAICRWMNEYGAMVEWY